jgi:hypothetical protein
MGRVIFQGGEMTTNEVNPGKGCFGWVAKVFGGIFGLITLGSAIVGILQYFDPSAPPAPNPVVVTVVADEPVSEPSNSSDVSASSGITPEQWQAVEDFLRGAVAAEIAAYEYGDPSYASMFYGDALQTIQTQIADLNARGVMLAAQFDVNSSYVHDIRAPSNNRIEVDSCEYWAQAYYDRLTGTLLESTDWTLVPQTIMIEYLNADFYITSVAFYGDQAFCN